MPLNLKKIDLFFVVVVQSEKVFFFSVFMILSSYCCCSWPLISFCLFILNNFLINWYRSSFLQFIFQLNVFWNQSSRKFSHFLFSLRSCLVSIYTLMATLYASHVIVKFYAAHSSIVSGYLTSNECKWYMMHI